MCMCVCVCVCVCVLVCVCVKVLKEELTLSVKNLNAYEIDTILKTYKYKQYKKNSLYCVSHSTLCMGEKVQNVQIFKKF